MQDDFDHRSLGQRQALFHFQEEAPGSVFWHPRGRVLFRMLEEKVRQQVLGDGYQEVATPQVLNQRIWEQSGHWEHFRENMMLLEKGESVLALKPVSCPGHIQVVQQQAPSYRDLPLRLSEFGLVHRHEPSGALMGLFRLRQFTQDDGHIFCLESQVEAEVERFCRSLLSFYAAFGFHDVDVAFSSRPEQRASSDAVWDRAEAALQGAAQKAGLSFRHQPGQGAFYGPKLEFGLKDRQGRSWQCGTLQLDVALPERFELSYVGSSGVRERPVMLHRALLGSLERFLGILLEHHEGRLPAWMAPEQARVVTVNEQVRGYAERVVHVLQASGVRARMDLRNESLARKIAEAHQLGVPYVLTVGPREAANETVRLRDPAGVQSDLSWAALAPTLMKRCAPSG